MNGNEVARQIRKSEQPETPIIAMIGYQEMGFQGDLFDSVTIKPFKLQALGDTIGLYL
jgi:CheY-like chemotaxis protein